MLKRMVWLVALGGVLLVSGFADAGGKVKKPNPAFAAVQEDPKLPYVLLIGDSISIGYTPATQKLLAGKANVLRIPENGGPTISGLKKIDPWLGKREWDVIHFNWGLHDLKMDDQGKHQVPLEEYEKNLDQLVKRMKSQGKVLIWASTTPVPEGKLSPPRQDKDVQAYNQKALEIMKKNGVVVNDLYAFVLPKLADLQKPVNVHFTDQGSEALAGQVAAAIARELKK